MPTIMKFRPRYLSMGLEYCDFAAWTTRDLFVKQILPDQEFWEKTLSASSEFFSKCILPEIVGKYYTSPGCEAQAIPSSSTSSCDEDGEGPWCYSQQDLDGSTLIGCDNICAK